MSSISNNPGITPGDNNAIAQRLAQTLTAMANAKNAAAISNWQKDGGPLPQIINVNQQLVIQFELAGVEDGNTWNTVYSYSTYQPPVTPLNPNPGLPTIVIGPFGEPSDFPNTVELAPDGPYNPVGSVVVINGVKYTKTIVAANPFSPLGGTTAWKF